MFQHIPAFAEQLDAAKDYADFERIKNEINDFLMQMFEGMLE